MTINILWAVVCFVFFIHDGCTGGKMKTFRYTFRCNIFMCEWISCDNCDDFVVWVYDDPRKKKNNI